VKKRLALVVAAATVLSGAGAIAAHASTVTTSLGGASVDTTKGVWVDGADSNPSIGAAYVIINTRGQMWCDSTDGPMTHHSASNPFHAKPCSDPTSMVPMAPSIDFSPVLVPVAVWNAMGTVSAAIASLPAAPIDVPSVDVNIGHVPAVGMPHPSVTITGLPKLPLPPTPHTPNVPWTKSLKTTVSNTTGQLPVGSAPALPAAVPTGTVPTVALPDVSTLTGGSLPAVPVAAPVGLPTVTMPVAPQLPSITNNVSGATNFVVGGLTTGTIRIGG